MDSAIVAAASLAHRYLTARKLPDAAIDLLGTIPLFSPLSPALSSPPLFSPLSRHFADFLISLDEQTKLRPPSESLETLNPKKWIDSRG